MPIKKFDTEFGGRKLIISSGYLAKQANASCLVQYGDTMVLATATMNDSVREGMDYFPLMVDYEERLYAAGKIKGSRFIKREGRPTDEAVITGRMIDRGLRPLFNQKIRNEVQVVVTVLCIDNENDPDIPSIIAASTALSISDIPWNGPLTGIKMGYIDGQFVVNPTTELLEKSDLDLTLSVGEDKVLMIEAGAKELPEDLVYQAFEQALKHGKPIIKFIKQVQKEIGKEKIKEEELLNKINEFIPEEEKMDKKELEQWQNKAKEYLEKHIAETLFNEPKASKAERKTAIKKLKDMLKENLIEQDLSEGKIAQVMNFFDDYIDEKISYEIVKNKRRIDGRQIDEIRRLACDVSLIPRTHGSGLFNRGATQVLSIVTLGAPGDEQLLDSMEESGKKRYMHHYNFPPFSVGETGFMRGPGRRDIGHGALAEKALLPVLPERDDFPYTIRVVSEVLGSNGSSSMASTCGSSLALMDAGVPIRKAVAGIAMGLAWDDKGNHTVIADLQDLEDGKGGMDFKITGTDEGITAIQMDTKTDGLTLQIVQDALREGKKARLNVLDAMNSTIVKPRPDLSPYAPRITSFKIDPDKIREVIGPGGKVINEIIDNTGVTIDIEDDGMVMITSIDAEASQKAEEWIRNIVREVKVGEVFTGPVTRIMDFGAFVQLLPNQEGMVHISEISEQHVNKIQDVLKIGQVVQVKVIKIDELGRINLSMKRANKDYNESDDKRRGDHDRGRRR